MKFSSTAFALAVAFSSFASAAHAESQLVCEIENPCAWLEPVPGTDHQLGFCVSKLKGDRSELLADITAADGTLIRSVPLRVSLFNEKNIRATDEAGNFELAVGRYGDFYAGGFLVKTANAPDGLGFMTSCSASEVPK